MYLYTVFVKMHDDENWDRDYGVTLHLAWKPFDIGNYIAMIECRLIKKKWITPTFLYI